MVGGKPCCASVNREGFSPAKPPRRSSSTISSMGWAVPTARRARRFDMRIGSRATSPSTSGASACSCTGATWRCCRGAGPRRCPRAPARQRSSPGCWGRITTTRSCWRWPGSAVHRSSSPRTSRRSRRCATRARSSSGPRPSRAARGCSPSRRATSRSAWRSTGRRPSAWPHCSRPRSGCRQAGAERKGQERALSQALSEPARASDPPAPTRASQNPAANPNDAMNHGCHRLKLVPPSRAQVTKVA